MVTEVGSREAIVQMAAITMTLQDGIRGVKGVKMY